jgi:hypothetical protein
VVQDNLKGTTTMEMSIWTLARMYKKKVPRIVRAMESGEFPVVNLELDSKHWKADPKDVEAYYYRKNNPVDWTKELETAQQALAYNSDRFDRNNNWGFSRL